MNDRADNFPHSSGQVEGFKLARTRVPRSATPSDRRAFMRACRADWIVGNVRRRSVQSNHQTLFMV